MTFICKFEIPGEPMGQPRHRSRIAKKSDGSQFIANYDPSTAVKRKRLIALLAANAMRGEPIFDGPVGARIEFYFGLAKSHHRKTKPVEERWHTSKPDGDNALKMVQDACSGIVFRDDSQVSSVVINKRRCRQDDEPRTIVEFWSLDHAPI